MKKIICSLFILAFLTSCKECGPGKKAPEVSFELEGIYGVYESFVASHLAGSDLPAEYGAVCIEIQNPDVFVVRFLDLKKIKDIHMKWKKLEEGKYKISYKDQEAFFYDHRMDKDLRHPDLTFVMSLKDNKPLSSDTGNYTKMTKLFNYPTLDECTEYEKGQLDQDPDPGPDN
ncbi:hypothetical protein AB3N59_05080 [Leptospira sp. WS92.C1]